MQRLIHGDGCGLIIEGDKQLDPGVEPGVRQMIHVMLDVHVVSGQRTTRRRVTRTMLVGLLALVSCGGDRNVVELDNGFDQGFRIVRQIPGVPYQSGPENLGAVLTFDMHMGEEDKDCMVREAFADRSPEIPYEGYEWSAQELNELAARCSVDFSDMWRTAGG